MSHPTPEILWVRYASSLARRINFGWWLERFNGLLIAVLMLLSLGVLGLRTYREATLPLEYGAVGLAAVVLALAVVAWFLSRKQYIGVEAGLVRLDDRLRLNNRLTSASRNVGGWPDFPAGMPGAAQFRWNRMRAWLPGILALSLAVSAWFVPVPIREAEVPVVAVEPSAWKQMEDWLTTLEDEELIDEKSMEDLEARIEELRDQPEEDWFSHSSLEATDTLVDTLGPQLRDLGMEMATLDRDLTALKTYSSEMSEAARQELLQEFEAALEALKGNSLAVNDALLQQLQKIDPSQLGKETLGELSAEQLKALQQQLQKGSGALGSMQGLPPMNEDASILLMKMGNKNGIQPGQGDVQRGRGDAPLFFGDKEDNLGTETIEKVTNPDLSKATIGEVLSLGETEREIDKRAVGSRSGGAVGSTGQGGDSVSRQALLPDEQAVLKRYFK